MLPSIADWRITSACTMSCPFCYGPKGIPHLSPTEASDAIVRLRKMGIETVCVSGGEPLLYPGIDSVLAQLAEQGFEVFLSTSGHKYQDHAECIEKSVTKLSLPLDGHTAEAQYANGRTKTSFRNVLSILAQYEKAPHDFQIKIATLITTRNLEGVLPPLYELLKDYSIDLWKIYEMVPEGRGAENYKDLGYSHGEFEKAIAELNASITTPPSFPIIVASRRARDAGYFIVQPDGIAMIPIDMGKRVEERVIGSILKDAPATILANWQEHVNVRNYISNVRLGATKPSVDDEDCRLLFELDKDPLQSIAQLSASTGMDGAAVHARIERLFSDGIIHDVIPIVNLDKLGLDVYLVNLSLGAVDKADHDGIVSSLVGNPNVAWVVRCSGAWSLMIAIFARGPDEYGKIMRGITAACGDGLVSHDTHVVYEKYILGQRYLAIPGSSTSFMFDNSRIKLGGREKSALSHDQHMVLSRIRESRQASIQYIAGQLSMSPSAVASVLESLSNIDFLKKFQPIFDVPKLGYEWYEVFVKFRNLTEERRMEFTRYICEIPQVVHINSTLGAWEMNFEVHSRNKQDFLLLYKGIRKRFATIIREEEFVRIHEEYKFSFLVDVVLDEARRRVR